MKRFPSIPRNLVLRWVVVPALAGVLVGTAVDHTAPPLSGRERLSAVFLLDGQTYFGHLTDLPWSDTLTLRDVYYLQQAREANPTLGLAVVKRGTEAHQPDDGMRIRRDKVLLIERVRTDSAVARAIQAERSFASLREGTP